ncbi:MAG: TlpA family protein disulfide reductase [Acidobacteria bacterium]|nr:TlpA family protein disulfide reductase [Acidobacteriota bacterium]
MWPKNLLVSCAFTLLLLVPSAVLAGSDDREPAPRFHAKTMEGEQFTNESVKGRVVLFQFWTTWCPYCKSEEALVNDITKEFSDKGLIVLAVDVAESKKKVVEYLKDHPRKCRIVLTSDTNLAAMYAANSYPIYVVVDRDGKIVDTQRGAGGERSLRRMLESAGLESKGTE